MRSFGICILVALSIFLGTTEADLTDNDGIVIKGQLAKTAPLLPATSKDIQKANPLQQNASLLLRFQFIDSINAGTTDGNIHAKEIQQSWATLDGNSNYKREEDDAKKFVADFEKIANVSGGVSGGDGEIDDKEVRGFIQNATEAQKKVTLANLYAGIKQ